MKPDKKYMSEASSGNLDIHFIPPTFSSEFRQESPPDQNPNEFLDLYPSETENEFLYCYYSSFGDCNNSNFNNIITNNPNYNPNNNLNYNPSNNPNYNTNNVNNNSNNTGNTSDNMNYNTTNNNVKNQSYTRVPMPSEILMNFDLDLDEDTDLERTCCENDIDKIYASIVKNNSGIFSTLSAYRIPSPIAKIIVRRLIKLTLSYCEKEGD